MRKKESTVSRWGRVRKLISPEISKRISSIEDTEEQIDEVLKTAIALEVQTNVLVRLAEKLGCHDAEEEIVDGVCFYASIISGYADVAAEELLHECTQEIEVEKERQLFPMKGEVV